MDWDCFLFQNCQLVLEFNRFSFGHCSLSQTSCSSLSWGPRCLNFTSFCWYFENGILLFHVVFLLSLFLNLWIFHWEVSSVIGVLMFTLQVLRIRNYLHLSMLFFGFVQFMVDDVGIIVSININRNIYIARIATKVFKLLRNMSLSIIVFWWRCT